MILLDRAFFEQEVVVVARQLLGKRLVRCLAGVRLAGIIVETEAYRGEEDLACHAKSGKTARNAVMYGPAGHAYVYFTYGMHWCLNAVCGAVGFPAAVLIRAIIPTEGLDEMAKRRGRFERAQWCNGPAKLCQALSIDGTFNGVNLSDPASALAIEEGIPCAEAAVRVGPRVGIGYAPEPWLSMPWRFSLEPGSEQSGILNNGSVH
jgi:DNA-3-methyladenine glycosylase